MNKVGREEHGEKQDGCASHCAALNSCTMDVELLELVVSIHAPLIHITHSISFYCVVWWRLFCGTLCCWQGLEVIEAHYLFGADYDNIEIVIHPQSIIHSMVETQVRV